MKEKKHHLAFLRAWKQRARHLKTELLALRVAWKENLVPWPVKLLIILTVGYALSPVDLIPDFIPVLGWLDDLLIVPALIYLTINLIPEDTMRYCRQAAKSQSWPIRGSWIVGGLIVLIWIGLGVWVYRIYWR